MNENTIKYTVSIEFEHISLPPFKDVLILGRGCPHGKHGIAQCFNLLAPDDFELIDLEDEKVQAMLISKSLLKRMPVKKITEIIRDNVFPYISGGELIKVAFRLKLLIENIEGTLD
ncbi:MAG: hypothetical protein J7M30_07630 [Deltaproteobacteria bacterium]|nr:hypothetical protein [Deltaproteobacteria bacterium]